MNEEEVHHICQILQRNRTEGRGVEGGESGGWERERDRESVSQVQELQA